MTPQAKLHLAGRVISYGKAVAPDRFPTPSEMTMAAWADVIGGMSVPVDVWPEAVRLWAGESTSDRMATPADLRRAAGVVLERWESDPAKRPALRALREARREQRDRELAAGTFGEVRGYSAPLAVERRRADPSVVEAARAAVGLPSRGNG